MIDNKWNEIERKVLNNEFISLIFVFLAHFLQFIIWIYFVSSSLSLSHWHSLYLSLTHSLTNNYIIILLNNTICQQLYTLFSQQSLNNITFSFIPLDICVCNSIFLSIRLYFDKESAFLFNYAVIT